MSPFLSRTRNIARAHKRIDEGRVSNLLPNSNNSSNVIGVFAIGPPTLAQPGSTGRPSRPAGASPAPAYSFVTHVPPAQKVAWPSCENTHAPLAAQAPLGAVAGPV